MDAKNNPKLKKPLSFKTLRQTLRGMPQAYRDIEGDCILAATGLDDEQRREALERLKQKVPEGQKVYVAVVSDITSSRRRDLLYGGEGWRYGLKVIAWTYEDASCWQTVTRIAPNFRTLKLVDGMHYFSIN